MAALKAEIRSGIFPAIKNLAENHYPDRPVYLVGSSLFQDEPMDIDVLVILTDEEFAYCYGDVDKWIDEGNTGQWTDCRWRHASDVILKRNEMMTIIEWKYLIDLMIIPEKADCDKPKELLYVPDNQTHSIPPQPEDMMDDNPVEGVDY